MWNVITLIHKEGIMEAHEEVDIVIGEKKEFLCDTVTEFTCRQKCHSKVLLFCVRKDLGVFNFCLNAFKWKI